MPDFFEHERRQRSGQSKLLELDRDCGRVKLIRAWGAYTTGCIGFFQYIRAFASDATGPDSKPEQFILYDSSYKNFDFGANFLDLYVSSYKNP